MIYVLSSNALASQPHKTAFLGVEFLNDNAMYEPTSDAERARMKTVESLFTSELERSGEYRFVTVPKSMKAQIMAGQSIGECGGCEIDYAKKLEVDRIAWIRVQKVSNLILNMNVYIADVATERMTFVRSVDIRGNTDESWSHSIRWLMKKYLIKPASRVAD